MLKIAIFIFWALLTINPQTIRGEENHPLILKVVERNLTINNKTAKILSLVAPNDTVGLKFNKGDLFDVIVNNQLNEPTCIHWHGLILPYRSMVC